MVDAYYAQIFRELLTYMMEDPRNIFRATRVQSIAKYLERIGDHATNLAEMVVFMVKGKDIRHRGQARTSRGAAPAARRALPLRRTTPRAARWPRAGRAALLPASARSGAPGSSPPTEVTPLAVEVMREVGIDIAGQRPKAHRGRPARRVDTVVTLCAEEVCPVLPGSMRRERWDLPDPAAAAGERGGGEGGLPRCRDELRKRMEALVKLWG